MAGQSGSKGTAALRCAHVLGVPVHIVETREVIQLMEEWIARREPRWIAVTSSHGIVEARKRSEFKAILKSADLSLPDGKWTARWAAHRASCETRQVRGADLLMEFLAVSGPKGYRSFFYGDTEEVLESLTVELRKRYPPLDIAGTFSPPFRATTPEENAGIVGMINRANADVLWVGLGLPRQEQWIFEHRHRLKVPVLVAVGAAFKFVAGKVRTAPLWLSELGLEWAWRLAQEPRKTWRRAMVYGPQFAGHALLDLTGLRKYE